MDGITQDLPDAIAADAGTPAIPPETAFTALVERHARFLYRVAFSLLRNPQDAEDAVQDTLLKLFRTRAWQHMADEKAFLACAVWRTGLTRLSSAPSRAMKNSEDVTELDLASPSASPEANALDSARRATMRTLIQALPEPLRQPLLLSAIEGMRSHEVAAILHIPEGTVRTRILRARLELRQRFLALEKVHP